MDRFRLPGCHASIERAVDRVERILREYGIAGDFAHRIIIGMSEAVTNAVHHGNDTDSSKNVHFEICIDDQEVSICVLDEGGGFDPEQIKDPLSDENLTSESGRGVYLMHELADAVEFTDGGREVRIRFFLE